MNFRSNLEIETNHLIDIVSRTVIFFFYYYFSDDRRQKGPSVGRYVVDLKSFESLALPAIKHLEVSIIHFSI